MPYAQFREWLEREYAYDNGCLEDWMFPQTSYWLYENEKPIGANFDNIASNKVILKHGGVWIRTSNHQNFYHIDLD